MYIEFTIGQPIERGGMPTSSVKCPVCLYAYEIPFLIEKTLIFVRITELGTYRIAWFFNETILFIHDK